MSERSDDKKTQILNAATLLMRDQGVQALSFENVANEAGLSRQLVRYYFPDLDGLIAELCDYLAGAYRDILVAGIVEISQVERLKFFLDFFFDLSDKYPMPDHLEVYDALVAYSVGSPQLKQRMRTQYKTLGDVILHELAIAHPELDPRSCEELSYLFVSMMHAHWSFVASLGHSRQHNALTRTAIDRLIASYVENPEPTPGLDRAWATED